MWDEFEVDRRTIGRISRAVYLVLEKYHRKYGLSVVSAHDGPEGYYHGFYSLAVRDQDERPFHLLEVEGRYALTIYQAFPGVPSWSSGTDSVFAEERESPMSTKELAAWYAHNLSLRRFFSDNAEAIRRWRLTYSVSESEPYLLTWNVMSELSARVGETMWTYSRADLNDEGREWEQEAASSLGCKTPDETVHFCGGLAFATDGRVLLPDHSQVDMWSRHLAGEEPSGIVDSLARTMDGNKRTPNFSLWE